MPPWIEVWENYRKEEGGLPEGGDVYLAMGSSVMPLNKKIIFLYIKTYSNIDFSHNAHNFKYLQNSLLLFKRALHLTFPKHVSCI